MNAQQQFLAFVVVETLRHATSACAGKAEQIVDGLWRAMF